MAHTYSKIYIQVVFAVKHRQSLIEKTWKESLYRYIAGIVKQEKQTLYSIGGVEDHIHLLLGIRPSCCLSSLVQRIKANSSRWINEQKFTESAFSWQTGFGAFSYAQSQLEKVKRYIQKQEEHHRKNSFRQEYTDFLQSFQIEYEEENLFDFLATN